LSRRITFRREARTGAVSSGFKQMLLLKIPAKQDIIAESEPKARRLHNEHKAPQESKTEGDIELVNLKKREEGVK